MNAVSAMERTSRSIPITGEIGYQFWAGPSGADTNIKASRQRPTFHVFVVSNTGPSISVSLFSAVPLSHPRDTLRARTKIPRGSQEVPLLIIRTVNLLYTIRLKLPSVKP
jgi:hypothetical protein